MRTIGKTRHYCAHCGFDLPNGDEDHSIMCPACDGDICKPKRREVADNEEGESQRAVPGHLCDARLLPGECLVCVGKPKPTIRIESWAGSHVVPVEVIGVTAKRWRIRFLDDCQKGKRGMVRLVKPEVVRMGGQTHGQVVAQDPQPLRPLAHETKERTG